MARPARHAPWRDRTLRDILARARHDGCGGLPGKAVLLTGGRGRVQPGGAEDRAAERLSGHCRVGL